MFTTNRTTVGYVTSLQQTFTTTSKKGEREHGTIPNDAKHAQLHYPTFSIPQFKIFQETSVKRFQSCEDMSHKMDMSHFTKTQSQYTSSSIPEVSDMLQIQATDHSSVSLKTSS